jgi:hypothetical protein
MLGRILGYKRNLLVNQIRTFLLHGSGVKNKMPDYAGARPVKITFRLSHTTFSTGETEGSPFNNYGYVTLR